MNTNVHVRYSDVNKFAEMFNVSAPTIGKCNVYNNASDSFRSFLEEQLRNRGFKFKYTAVGQTPRRSSFVLALSNNLPFWCHDIQRDTKLNKTLSILAVLIMLSISNKVLYVECCGTTIQTIVYTF
jgi:hypothetical protein